jgi:hypothetical protein
VFRLFPTGENRYAKGTEVFNSYGRRPNDNLLIDYGFAMEDNEWDSVRAHVCMHIHSQTYAYIRLQLYIHIC